MHMDADKTFKIERRSKDATPANSTEWGRRDAVLSNVAIGVRGWIRDVVNKEDIPAQEKKEGGARVSIGDKKIGLVHGTDVKARDVIIDEATDQRYEVLYISADPNGQSHNALAWGRIITT